jgi:eukaryotic-like serine/threonine-protein kinase
MSVQTKQFYAFGPFRLDSEKRVLVRDGKPVPLAPKTTEMLLVLIENAGHLVDKDDLMRRVWPDAFVEEGNLNKNISVLRKVLGEWDGGQEYIETVPKRGYRFVAPIFEVTHAEAGYQSQTSAGANLTGKKVSHYRIVEPLGGGGMGMVYRAEDLKLGRRVALKFLPEELASDPVALGRFEREARAASALDHPNICAIYEFGEHEGQPFIVMQHLEGVTLRERLAGLDGLPRHAESGGKNLPFLMPPFTTDELLDLAIQIADGIEAAHQKGIIHRDIKPANIFITHRGEAKILDFGVAKLLDVDEQVNSSAGRNERDGDSVSGAATHSLSLTRTGIAMGTASYMSPEQVRAERLDTRTDLFSFGLVLYEMSTGQQAFAGNTAAVVHEAILRETPLSARQLNPKLPPKLEEVITKALEKDREARYQNASEIQADLSRLRRDHPPDRVWRMVVASLFAVLVVASIIFVFSKRYTSLPTEPRLRQLTTNSTEDPVRTGAISPDGKFLAYADLRGIHVKLIETGDTKIVPQPEALKESRVDWTIVQWFPDSLRFVANLIPPLEAYSSEKHVSIWTVSVLGGEPRKLRDDADASSVSPDGSLVTFGTNPGPFGDREIWVMGPNGEQAHELFETDEKSAILGATWSSDRHRLAYIKIDKSGAAIESRDLKSGLPTTMLKDDGRLATALWLPDGRLIYALRESEASRTCNFWQMRIDARTGEPLDKPTRVTSWVGFCLDIQSVTADSKRLSFLEWAAETSVYIATLGADGTRITTPKRLTLSENRAEPSAWTADSKTVIFMVKRDDRWGIFKQSIEGNMAEPIVPSIGGSPVMPNERYIELPRTSPDGTLVLYRVIGPPGDSSPAGVRLMRVPIAGGTPELVLTANFYGRPSCARAPATLCAIGERSQDLKQIVFTAFDPLKGRGRELTRFDTDAQGNYEWALSPDGSRIAILNNQEGRIHILFLEGDAQREFKIKGLDGLDTLTWAAGGKSLFISSRTQYDSVLLHVDLQGNAQVLWRKEGGLATFGIPSPDGRHLAMLGWTLNSNIWMMENF